MRFRAIRYILFELWATTRKHLFLSFLLVLSERSLRCMSCRIVLSPRNTRTAWRGCSIRCTGFFLWCVEPYMCLLLHRHIPLFCMTKTLSELITWYELSRVKGCKLRMMNRNTFQDISLRRRSRRKTQPLNRLKNIPPVLKILEVQGHTWNKWKCLDLTIELKVDIFTIRDVDQCDKTYRKTPAGTVGAKDVLATLLMYKQ